MQHQQILTEIKGRVGVITLNQPEKLNAFSSVMSEELCAQISAWNDDESVGAIMLTGNGRAFCAGADISGFERHVDNNGESDPDVLVPASIKWIDLVRQSKPIVCAINGVAVGVGVTMTLSCDIRVASDEARLSLRFPRMGVTPEYASTHFLAQLVGLGNTMELMLTGRFVDANEAKEIGLVNHVYPADAFFDSALALAQQIAENPTWHLHQTKRMVHDHYLERDMEQIIKTESVIFNKSRSTDAHKEALLAFRERREPKFN